MDIRHPVTQSVASTTPLFSIEQKQQTYRVDNHHSLLAHSSAQLDGQVRCSTTPKLAQQSKGIYTSLCIKLNLFAITKALNIKFTNQCSFIRFLILCRLFPTCDPEKYIDISYVVFSTQGGCSHPTGSAFITFQSPEIRKNFEWACGWPAVRNFFLSIQPARYKNYQQTMEYYDQNIKFIRRLPHEYRPLVYDKRNKCFKTLECKPYKIPKLANLI